MLRLAGCNLLGLSVVFLLLSPTATSEFHCEGAIKCSTQDKCYTTKERCDGISQCDDASDEFNCSTTETRLRNSRSNHENLAWLITPVLFGLGVIFSIYKCAKDGLCNICKLRRNTALEDRHGNYLPLSHVHFYSMTQAPHSDPHQPGQHGPGQRRPGHCCRHQHSPQMMVIHNHQSFSLSLGNSARYQPHVLFSGPPSYEEAIACGSRGALSTVPEQEGELPAYSDVWEGELPAYSDVVQDEADTQFHIDLDEEDEDVTEESQDTCQLLDSTTHRQRHASADFPTRRQRRASGANSRRNSDLSRRQRHRSEPCKGLSQHL
ncbi:hypothetical protein LSAT2_024418 [Lamellibrachia satsuma]|nr:hypothetical protein LSAT2_024418 [Lamellibrachia satsuma]